VATRNVHQSGSSDHDRLGFHPDCPACRQDRLFGALSPRPVFSYRVRVLLATGVLALSAGAATTSVASEPDRGQEGVSVPEQGSSPAPGDSTGENAGGVQGSADDELGQGSGGETALPIEVDPLPSDPENGPSGGTPGDEADAPDPLEPQPATDPDADLGLTDPGAPDAIDVEDVPVPPTEPDPPVAPSLPVAPSPDLTPPPPPAPAPPRERHRAGRKGHKGDRRANDPATRERRVATAAPPPATAPPPSNAPAVSTPVQVVSAATAAPAPPPGAGRSHVVRPGESLWSIGADLLGPEASTAAIAAEVQRLWGLNEARIGTRDPDLLPVGVKLRLR
jgi:outer membrane biosynthesis protein TonB